MAAVVTAAKLALFETMLKTPTLADMLNLTPSDFEQFVAHVFRSAGYTVKVVAGQHFPYGPGVDLELYPSPGAKKPIARVEIKRYAADNRVGYEEVKGFNGILNHGEPLPGYFVTTSDYHPHARTFAADTNGKLRLLDGRQFLRYITYIRGSRVAQPDGAHRTATLTPPDWICTELTSRQCDPRRTTVLTVANGRGGIGKTTSALNLAVALTQRGLRVLLVDLDGQASLSSALPLPDPHPKPPKNAPPPERQRYITDYFSGRSHTLADLVQSTRIHNLWLIPANEELYRMDSGGSARVSEELAFVTAIHDATVRPLAGDRHDEPFDWIILDTPPAQSHYTRVALAAAHYVLVPVRGEAFGVLGINKVLSQAATMRALVGSGVRVTGCLITWWKNTKSARDVLPKLQSALDARDIKLYAHAIPYEDRIEQAHLSMVGGGIRTIFGFGSNEAAARYKDVLSELIQEVRPHVNEPGT